jgi:hypothetical protein
MSYLTTMNEAKNRKKHQFLIGGPYFLTSFLLKNKRFHYNFYVQTLYAKVRKYRDVIKFSKCI